MLQTSFRPSNWPSGNASSGHSAGRQTGMNHRFIHLSEDDISMATDSTLTLKSMIEQVTHIYTNEELFGAADGRTQTVEEFEKKIKSLAATYQDLGIEKGDRISLISLPAIEHAVAYHAAAKIGAVPSTLHHRDIPGQLANNIDWIGSTVLVFQSQFSELVSKLPADRIPDQTYIQIGEGTDADLDRQQYSEVIEEGGSPEGDVDVVAEDPGQIVFTSGTTGRPKPITLSNEALIESARSGQHLYRGIRASDTKLMLFAPSFVAWHSHSAPFTNTGAKTVFLDEFDPTRVLNVIEREGITHMSMTPTMWKEVLEEGPEPYDLSSLKMALYGGEIGSPDLIDNVRERICDHVLTAYGTTETAGLGGGAVIHSSELDMKGYQSVGRPMLNSDIIIADVKKEKPKELSRGELGEVLIKGPGVDPEIWGDASEYGDLTVDGWFLTGDLGYMDEDGYLFLEGRLDNLIISKGVNIQAEEVEAILDEHPDVRDIAIVGEPDEEWGQRITAHVYTDTDLVEDELEEWCLDHDELSDFKRPRTYVFHSEELPRTESGKLDRNALLSE